MRRLASVSNGPACGYNGAKNVTNRRRPIIVKPSTPGRVAARCFRALLRIVVVAALVQSAGALAAGEGRAGGPRHAIAMHGEPAMPADFVRVPYADPQAPKGGRLVHGVLGTFDSLNPLIVKGLAVQSVRGYVIESLLARGYDEPFTLYGLLAKTVETDAERILRHLHPRSGRALLRRQAGDAGRRDLFLATLARPAAGPITAPITPR